MATDNTPLPRKETLIKKGLGWIPDYPDLRDYQLDKEEIQKGGRLTREEGTSNLELLAESLIESLKEFQKIARSEQNTSEKDQAKLGAIISDLESKVFGDVSFIRVKLRKILRPLPIIKDSQQRFVQTFSPSFLSYKEDKLSQQSIYALKAYLFVLYKSETNGFLREPLEHGEALSLQEKGIAYKIQARFNDIQATFDWINDSNFDETTTELLKRFQKSKGIPAYGVVGMLTYNALSKCARSGKAKRTDDEKMPLNLDLRSIPEVQLISIPSLISSQIIDALFEGLIKVAAEKLDSENKIEDQDKKKEKHYEQSFFEKRFQCKSDSLKEEFCEDFQFPSFEKILRNTRECLSRNGSNRLIVESLQKDRVSLFSGYQKLPSSKREAIFLERSCKVINNEFKVIEPIVSVVLKLISPIAPANYQDLSEAVKEGLEKLDALAINPELAKSSRMSHFPLLITEALQKVRQELDEGLSLVTGEFAWLNSDRAKLLDQLKKLDQSKKIEDKNDIKRENIAKEMQLVRDKYRDKLSLLRPTLYFYFLLQKFVGFYDKNGSQSGQTANVFDKREFLEVEDSEQLYQVRLFFAENSSTNENDHTEDTTNSHDTSQLIQQSPNSQSEIFPIENLQIPVLISLAKIRGLNYLDSRTRAYLLLPGVVDLSFWCTPVEDQGTIQSCTALAGVALMEYFTNRSKGKYTELSSLFLYKVTRQQMNLSGDVGASLRETIKAMALFGVPPESAWEYDPIRVDEEPPPFCYSYAQNYQALKYFRLDYAGISREALLFQIKAVLAAGFPCMFGFTVYTSAYEDDNAKEGWIPFPNAERDKVVGGHAVVAVGYDDYQVIRQADRKDYSHGAILVRNCWGSAWGKGGYGWIPYDYIRQGLTRDWWSLLKTEWFESGLIGVGSNSGEQPYKG